MKTLIILLSSALLLFLLAVPALPADNDPGPMPLMKSLNPMKAKPGEVVTAEGMNLSAKFVAEVVISTGDNVELKVEVTEQTDEILKFRIPAQAPDGKYSVTILTARAVPVLFIQPVVLRVAR